MMLRMQITQELWEYDLATKFVKFMQQTCNKRLHRQNSWSLCSKRAI